MTVEQLRVGQIVEFERIPNASYLSPYVPYRIEDIEGTGERTYVYFRRTTTGSGTSEPFYMLRRSRFHLA
jgi:hypothetical protein